jgi:serine/threonine protein kinase
MTGNDKMNSSSCPEIGQFQRFRCRTLPASELETLARHLKTCPRCAEKVERLIAEESSVDGVAALPFEDTPPADKGILSSTERQCAAEVRLDPTFHDAVTVELIQPGSPGSVVADDLYDFLLPVLQAGAHVALGPYRIVGVLGTGGMGIVLKAEDPQLNRSVAVKMLKPGLVATSAARQRFLREARAAAAVINDHIVPIYHVGEDRGVPYLVMPLLVGETLEMRFKREGRLPLAEVLRIGREAATGLAAAHDRGLVHRDIKPGNLWLDAGSGRVHILDFGLARIEEENSQLSQADRPIGTPGYMAPEQARGETAGPRADLFSLGCILYRLSTGAAPFDCTTPYTLYHALVFDDPRPPGHLRPELPTAFTALVLRLLAKKANDRPASAHDVVREIEAIENELSRGSTRTRRPRRFLVTLAAAAAGVLLLALAYASAPNVYRIVTDQGDLVIETNDPGVEVIIKDGSGKVIDRTAKREILLKGGDYEIDCVIVDAFGEQRFLTRRLKIRRGDRLVVDAHIESAKLAKENAAKLLQAKEARAAQWALSRGAKGKILVRGNREDLAVARNETAGAYQVINLIFGPDSKLSDSELEQLHEIPNLMSLKLQGDWVSDTSMARLRGLSNLQRLDLVATRVSYGGLAHLGELTNLEHLILIDAPVTDAGLAQLRALRKLRHLALGYTRVTEAGMDHVASLPNLTGWLTLDNSKVTDAWLPHLTKLSGLSGLGLANNPIGDAGLASLEAFRNLEDLNLSHTKVGNAGLVHLKSLRKLNKLRLTGTGVSDPGLAHLAGLSALRDLDLTRTKVSSEGVAELQKALPRCHILPERNLPPGR